MGPDVIFQIVAFLFAISIHESAHAWSANKLGDPTAMLLGRITLNPIKHIDPIGTILLPLFAAISNLPMFGWAKPTPVDTRQLRHPRRDDVLVSAAGPASNFLVVAVSAALLLAIRAFAPDGATVVGGIARGVIFSESGWLTPVALLLYYFLLINLLLGVFNLIPIPPLDGSHILAGALPKGLRNAYEELGRYSFLLILLLIWTGIPTRLFLPVLGLFHALLSL